MQTNYEGILINYGFEKSGGCHCGGVQNKKYKKDDLVVYLRPKTFKIRKGQLTIVPLTELNKLNETLAAKEIWAN